MYDKAQRGKIFRVSTFMILDMMKTGWVADRGIRCIDGLPDNVFLLDIKVRERYIDMFFTCPDWDMVEAGDEWPQEVLTYTYDITSKETP